MTEFFPAVSLHGFLGRVAPLRTTALCDWAAAALLAFASGVALVTFPSYGMTIDEPVQNEYGKLVMAWYASGFQNRGALEYVDLFYYGGLFELATALVQPLSGLGAYETRHLLNVAVGLLGVAGCWRLARTLGGPLAGLLAVGLLLLTPVWYGQMFNNPKDVPFAAGYVWSLALLAQAARAGPKPPARLLLGLGLAIGASLGVRVGGVLLLGLLAALPAAAALERRSEGLQAAAESARVLLPAALLAYALMLAAWPWAQLRPLSRPLEALRHFSHLDFTIPVLHRGQIFAADHLPLDYLPLELGLRLPEPILALLALAALLGALELRRRPGVRAALPLVLTAAAALLPVAMAVAMHSTLFDGVRHLTFVLPPLVALAATAGAVAARRAGALAAPALLGLLVWAGHQATDMATLHPYEYIWHNALAGGVPGAAGRYELDYWASSYREVALQLAAEVEWEAGGTPATEYGVMACGSPDGVEYYLPPWLKVVHEPEQADFYVSFTRFNCDRELEGRPMIRIERMGVTLAVALDRRELTRPQEETPGLAASPPDF